MTNGPRGFRALDNGEDGYQRWQGQEKDGTGIINPIEVKHCLQGAGVGVVKEKMQQAKAEAWRAA